MNISKGDIINVSDKHIIVCGSSLSNASDHLLERLNIELCLTDPPYGVNLLGKKPTLGSGGRTYKKIHGDNNTAAFKRFYEKIILGYAVEKMMIFGGNYFAHLLPPQKGWLTWQKHTNEKLSFSQAELIYTNLNINTDVIKYQWNGCSIEAEERGYNVPRFHPAQKPVGLLKRLIETANISDGAYIVDGFGGSLSLLFASEMTGKRCVIFELESEYIVKALEVYEELYPEARVRKRVAFA